MKGTTKEELLKEIEKLMAYGKEDPTINPSLLEYLDLETLISIHDSLKEKTATLKEEDKEWLRQFRQESSE